VGRIHLTAIVAVLLALIVVPFGTTASHAGELRSVETRPAPTLELTDLGGETRRLADWRGQVVLINFWASWCPPCVQEMPSIQRLQEQMRGKPFAVVSINVAEAQRRAAQTVSRLGLDFPVLLDADGEAFKAWGGKGLPTSVLIDRNGTMRYLGLGPLEWDGAEAIDAIERLLAE